MSFQTCFDNSVLFSYLSCLKPDVRPNDNRKPNDRPLYINRLSNHAPSILNHLPTAISRCLTDISHDAEVFKEAAPLYNNVLKDNGLQDIVEYSVSRKAKKLVLRGAM